MAYDAGVKVLFAAAEFAPLARVGGLAAAAAGLVAELRRQGVEVHVVVPDYFTTPLDDHKTVKLDVPDWAGPASARSGTLAGIGEITLISAHGIAKSHPYLQPDGHGWPDNDRRFMAFSAALAALCRRVAPDVLHLNDWHTCAALGHLAEVPPTMLTIHTLGHQGRTNPGWLKTLPRHVEAFEQWGDCNPLLGGIRLADVVVAVSPHYAAEITTPQGGSGLDGPLRDRGDRLVGILNGIDTEEWNPANDRHLATRYSPDDMAGKAAMRAELLGRHHLADGGGPLLTMVTRLADQKGVDLLVAVAPFLQRLGATLIVLGDGEQGLADALTTVAVDHPETIAFVRGYDEALAHQLFAGADVFVMPSRFEPCGLAQMQAMRYGTLPLVTDVGGLHDTVIDIDSSPARGTGVVAPQADGRGTDGRCAPDGQGLLPAPPAGSDAASWHGNRLVVAATGGGPHRLVRAACRWPVAQPASTERITCRPMAEPKVLVVVLAGGEGRRLAPLTADRAKPAVPFGGSYRIIDFVLSNFANARYLKIVVLTQYKSHSLDRHISQTWRFSTLLGNYVTPVPAQMRRGPQWFSGSADAIYQNLNLISDERPDIVCVFGADHIYHMDPRQMVDHHQAVGAGVTVAAIPVAIDEASQFGIIEASAAGKIVEFHEKPANPPAMPGDATRSLASMGNYVFDTQTLIDVVSPTGTDDIATDIGGDVIPALTRAGVAHMYDFSTNVIPGAVRPRTWVLARRRQPRRLLRGQHGSDRPGAAVQPVQQRMAGVQPAVAAAAGQDRSRPRRSASHRRQQLVVRRVDRLRWNGGAIDPRPGDLRRRLGDRQRVDPVPRCAGGAWRPSAPLRHRQERRGARRAHHRPRRSSRSRGVRRQRTGSGRRREGSPPGLSRSSQRAHAWRGRRYIPASAATLTHSAPPARTSSTTPIHRARPRSPAPIAAPATAVTMPRYGAYRQLAAPAMVTRMGP